MTRRPLRRLRLLALSRLVDPVKGLACTVVSGLACAGALAGLAFSVVAGAFYWVVAGVSAWVLVLAITGLVRTLRLGRAEAWYEALGRLFWEQHTFRAGGRQLVVDAPGQDRWQFASLYRDVLRLTRGLWRPRRRMVRAQARAVAGAASDLLLDGPSLGQAKLRVFPSAGFARFHVAADDSHVPGAPDAYLGVLEDADAQLRELVAALREAEPSRRGPDLGPEEVSRLMGRVSMRELAEDPATRGGDPPVVEAALRLRAETAARAELERRSG